MTEAEVREEVERRAQTALEPTLEADEIDAALAHGRLFFEWEAEAEVPYGYRVAPSTRNGHRYRAVQGGTTGATEPTWGTSDYSQVSDGDVIWEEDGAASEAWDVRGAIYYALELRYAKDQLVDASGDGRSHKGSQRAERIEKLMRLYRPVGVS